MITRPILQHVIDTITQISIRPVVVMCAIASNNNQ